MLLKIATKVKHSFSFVLVKYFEHFSSAARAGLGAPPMDSRNRKRARRPLMADGPNVCGNSNKINAFEGQKS
jgi:hypothetical protein